MPSLEEAYDRRWASLREPRRVFAGLTLVAAGVLAVAIALVSLALDGGTAGKLVAGVAAGLGVPVMLVGVVVVLPASRRERLGVLAGTTLSTAGVVLFWNVYPGRWTRTADPLAFETLLLYGVGCALALWFVFTALASFRLRNNPQGTVQVEVIRQGETQTLQVSRDRYRELVSDGGDADELIRELK